MKGYFSRLIQQTGITVAGAPGQSFGRQNASITSIHAEEERIIAHPAKMTKETNSLDSIESPGIMSKIRENEDVHQPMEEMPKNELSGELQNEEPGERKAMVYARNAQIHSRKTWPQKEVKGLPNSEVEIDITDQDQQSNKQERQQSREDFTLKSAFESTDITGQEGEAYLKKIREWVAGTPLGYGEEIKSKPAIEMQEPENLAHSERDIITPSYPKQRSELNDFHLSIGTISLIIEDPRAKDTRKEPSRAIKVENRSMRENENSRLSRHYIRTG